MKRVPQISGPHKEQVGKGGLPPLPEDGSAISRAGKPPFLIVVLKY